VKGITLKKAARSALAAATIKNLQKSMWLALAAFLLLGVAACSGSSDKSAGLSEAAQMDQMRAPYEEAPQGNAASSVSLTSAAGQSGSAGAAQAQEGESGGVGPIAAANAGFDRKVIYRANLVMKVAEFAEAEKQLLDLIHLSNAYVLQFSDSRNANEVGAVYVIKVSSDGFSSFLDRLQKITNLKFEREVEGNDVTEEFVDLTARLKAKSAVEARLLAFMDKATRADDLIQFSNQLGEVQEEIERIKGRIRYLDENVAFSTVHLRLYQGTGNAASIEKEDSKHFGDRLYGALSGSAKTLRQFGEGLLVVLAALLPVLVAAAVIGVPVYAIVRKRAAARRRDSHNRRKEWNARLSDTGDEREDDEAARPSADPRSEPEKSSAEDEPGNKRNS